MSAASSASSAVSCLISGDYSFCDIFYKKEFLVLMLLNDNIKVL